MALSYKFFMRHLVAISFFVLLAACGGGEDKAQEPKAAETSAPEVVAFDPAFANLAGSWRSESTAIPGGRYLQIDIASGGGYTIDVRRDLSGRTEVSETGRGRLVLSDSSLTAFPEDTQGDLLKKFGAWTASATAGENRTMSLQGADGTRVSLAWQRL